MMTLEEAIKAEVAETLAYEECLNSLDDNMPTDMWNELNKSLGKQMDYHRQLAEWLREVEESRKVIDVFLQAFIDFDLDICCEDLMDDDDEVCMENCNNKTKDCWLRWAKLKAREVNADGDSN